MNNTWCRFYQSCMRFAMGFVNFRFPELIQGEGSVLRLPLILKNLGIQSVLIVTDAGLVSLGMIEPLVQKLNEEGIKNSVYSKTVPNPTVDNIEEAYLQYQNEQHQAVIAFGGGSPMDCAKGVIARVANPNKSIESMKGLLKVRHQVPLLFAIPTTAGTGSEATVAAVISNHAKQEKYTMNSPKLIPAYAILDPLLTIKLPKSVTSTTGIDALCHAIEAYIGHSNTKISEKYALKAIKAIFANLEVAYEEPTNIVARTNMLVAAYDAGVAFTRAYVGNVHALAHPLGAFYNTPHGLAIAVVLPHVLDFYLDKEPKRMAMIARELEIPGCNDLELARNLINKIKQLERSLEIPETLDCIQEKDLVAMVKRASHEANPLYPVPVIMSETDMLNIYHQIMTK